MKYLKQKKSNLYLLNCNRFTFLGIAIALGVLLNIILSLTLNYLFGASLGDENESANFLTSTGTYILIIFLAPLIETGIFQYLLIVLPLKYILPFKKLNIYLLTLSSSFLFALIHTYSIHYFVIAFLMGIYLGGLTIISEFLRNKKVTIFVSVFLTHSIVNFIAVLLD